MKLPFSNAFWGIVLLLAFYGVFGIWIPQRTIDQTYEQGEKVMAEARERNREQMKAFEAMQPSVYERAIDELQNSVQFELTPGDKLVLASRVWDMEVIKRLIAEGADVNFIRSEGVYKSGVKFMGVSPLMAGADSIEVVRLLLKSGADIGLKDARGRTALAFALDAQNGAYANPEIPKLLMDSGADSNVEAGIPSLITAIDNDAELSLIRSMIEKGANVNAVDSSNRNALSVAAEKGRADVVKLLIDNNIDLGRFAETALKSASQEKHSDVIVLLNRFVTPSDKLAGQTLDAAVRDGDIETVRALLDRFDISSGQGNAALLTAAANGYPDVAKLLIEKGADVNAGNGEDSALLLAIWNGHRSVFDLLLEKGADINAVAPKNGRTALQQAAAHGHAMAIQALVQKGADQSIVDGEGNTALMLAVGRGWHTHEYDLPISELSPSSKEVAEFSASQRNQIVSVVHSLLAAASPLINLQNNQGDTAALIAYKNNLPDMVLLLAKHGANLDIQPKQGNSVPGMAAQALNFDYCIQLVEAGADVNARDSKGMTVLARAVVDGRREVVSKLIELGADVNAQYGSDRSIFELVPEVRLDDIGELLVRAGADLNAYDASGRTLLIHIAQRGDNISLFQFLIRHGANLNLAEKEVGNTPLLSLLKQHGDSRDRKLISLLDAGADPFIQNRDGESPASWASHDLAFLKMLLDRKVEVQIDPDRILSLSLTQRNLEMFLYALNNGANPNGAAKADASQDRTTPLYQAIGSGAEIFAQTLLLHGADVDLGHQQSSPTPLMLAIEKGFRTPTVKSIIDKTKLINAKAMRYGEAYGYSALDLAVSKKRDDVVVLLNAAGAKKAVIAPPRTTKALNVSLARKHVEKFDRFIASGNCDKADELASFPIWTERVDISLQAWNSFCESGKEIFSGFSVTDSYYPKDSGRFMQYVSYDLFNDVDLENIILVDAMKEKSTVRGITWSFILSCSSYTCKVVGISHSPLKDNHTSLQ